jgi:hypothetical protein
MAGAGCSGHAWASTVKRCAVPLRLVAPASGTRRVLDLNNEISVDGGGRPPVLLSPGAAFNSVDPVLNTGGVTRRRQ